MVFAAAGDIMAKEMMEAIKLLKEDLPEIKIRFVNIAALSYRAIGTVDNKLSIEKFVEIFTADKPMVANFHGYPEALDSILSNYTARERLHVHGYMEEGSTTTPHEMLRRNGTSRYDIATDVAKLYGRDDLVLKYQEILAKNHAYALEYGEDMIK